ncbi:MAG: exonuclease SbcCD subunit D [Aerococcus suis]|nr:exonuclease SbcCD subunit D [Aerococcus suis]
MKIIHTADWHIGKVVNNFSMLDDQIALLNPWIDEVNDLNPDVVLLAGDLYDRSLPNRETVAAVNQLLTKMSESLSCPIVIIAGNHDSGERIDYVSQLLANQSLYLAGLPSHQPQKIMVNNADIYLLPFADHLTIARMYPDIPIHNIEDAVKYQLSLIKQDWDADKYHLLMYHGYVTPSRHTDEGHEELVYSDSERPTEIGTSEFIPSQLFRDFDYIALGHLHAAQRVGADNIRYSGSPLKYSKSEARHRKQYLEVDLTANGVEVTSHEFRPPHDLRVIRGLFADIITKKSTDYVFVELMDETVIHEGMERLRRQYPQIMGLEYVNLARRQHHQTAENMAQLAQKSPQAYFEDFFVEMTGNELTNHQRDIVKELWQTVEEEE